MKVMQGFILLFFDISGGEILIILIVAFLVFGPRKFPELAKKIGKTLNQAREASDSIKREIQHEADNIKNNIDPENAEKEKGNTGNKNNSKSNKHNQKK